MKITLLVSFFSLFLSFQAAAYAEKTYDCKNAEGLPNNTYTFKTVNVAPGISLPYVEVVRHYFSELEGEQIVKAQQISGLATVTSTAAGTETLLIGNFRLEFNGDDLVFCR